MYIINRFFRHKSRIILPKTLDKSLIEHRNKSCHSLEIDMNFLPPLYKRI